MIHGHALWLLPEARAFTRLSALIADLAQAEGGPPFEPHVTLLSGITVEGEDLIGRVRTLARGLAPAGVVLARARVRTSSRRCSSRWREAISTARTAAPPPPWGWRRRWNTCRT